MQHLVHVQEYVGTRVENTHAHAKAMGMSAQSLALAGGGKHAQIGSQNRPLTIVNIINFILFTEFLF